MPVFFYPQIAAFNHSSYRLTTHRKSLLTSMISTYICPIEINTQGVLLVQQKNNNMKKVTFILIAVLSFGVFTAQAAGKAESKSENNLELKLDTSTEYETVKIAAKVPSGLKNAVLLQLTENAKDHQLEGQVYMRLCVDNKNNVKIIGMNATSPSLKKYVEHQLSSTNVPHPGCEPGQVYMMKVNFNIAE